MRRKGSILFVFVFIQWSYSNAQTFLNGSFETTTAPAGCNYNLGNATFNGYMSNSNAYGAANEVDIQQNGCYVVGIPHGTRCIGLAGDPTDQVAIALSAPLVAGNNYSFTFYSHSEVTFRIQGNIQIGASTNNSSFGTLIFTGVTVPSTWVFHTVNFVAPNNATHITIRNIAGAIHWNQVDRFVMGAPLPIELISFEAKPVDRTVVLNWATSSEVNNDYFTLEKSQDGINFVEFTRVTGAGNSNTRTDYESIDENPYSGISYYRLRQTDYDGTEKVSEMKSINFENAEAIEIYPNPSNGNLTIGTNTQIEDIKIMNSWGEIVMMSNQGFENLDISELANGVYFIYITVAEKTVVKRVVKQ